MDLSWNLKRLLMAEIENEADGGDTPTTLASSLESVRSGYEPFDGFPAKEVESELLQLLSGRYGNLYVEDLISDDDWRRRAALPISSPP